MEYLSFVCQSSSLLPWPPSLGGYNLLQLRPHLWMNVISPQRCFLGRKVYQDSQHMKGEGIQGKICLSSWGLYPLILRKVPCNLPVIYSTNMGGHFLVFLIRTLKITFFVSVLREKVYGKKSTDSLITTNFVTIVPFSISNTYGKRDNCYEICSII